MIVPNNPVPWHDLSSDFISETLEIYCTDCVYISSAKWNGYEFEGIVKLQHYPFTKAKYINYVTASMLMVYLSQVGFLYARLLCENNLLPVRISTERYLELVKKGNVVITNLRDIRLRKKIPLQQSTSILSMKLERVFAQKNSPIGDLSFSFNGGDFKGNIFVMIMNH